MAQAVKNLPTIQETGLIPGSRRCPGKGNGNPPQYSCLENPNGQKSQVGYSPWGHKESDMIERLNTTQHKLLGLTGGSDSTESACNARDLGLIPGSGRSPGEGNGKPLQCSCLEDPVDRAAWCTTVCGVANSRTLLSV